MTGLNLTNNPFIQNVPLYEGGGKAWKDWALTQNFGLDGGPYFLHNLNRNNPPWTPTTVLEENTASYIGSNFAKGFLHDGTREGYQSSTSSYWPYTLDGSGGGWQYVHVGETVRIGERLPENLACFTGIDNEEEWWAHGGYSMGVRAMWYGMQLPFRKDDRTTYTIVTPEFSYRPGVRDLPAGLVKSHKFVINFQVPWHELRGGTCGGYWPETLVDAWPHRAAGYPLFGLTLERENSDGNLYMQFVCPSDLDWVVAQGRKNLGTAINHDPETNRIRVGIFEFRPIRADTGYVIQVFFTQDRRRVAVMFNGEVVYPEVELPTGIADYFNNPPYEEREIPGPFTPNNGAGAGIGLSTNTANMLQSAYPAYWTPSRIASFGQPTIGLGFAVMDNLVKNPNYTPPWYSRREEYENAVFGLHKVSVNRKPFPSDHGKQAPYYMNRPDGLNSAPPWANAGSPWSKSINRAALWQRNNLR